MKELVEGVAVGTRTDHPLRGYPVEELAARKSAVWNALSFLIEISHWPLQERAPVTMADLALARALCGELAWVHEWLAELIREHEEWVESLRR